MSLNPAVLLAVLPASLLKRIAVHLHDLAAALDERDVSAATAAVSNMGESIADYMEQQGFTPEKLYELMSSMGIDLTEINITTLFKIDDKTPRA